MARALTATLVTMLVSGLICALGLSASAFADPHQVKKRAITISNRMVRASIGQSPNSAAYVMIANSGPAPEALVSASCACAAKVEIHRTMVTRGVVSMPPVGPVTIPAHGQVSFRPGGYHLMLEDLKEPLKDGGEQNITLVFRHAGPITAAFHIRSRINADGGPSMAGMGR
ncbi:MAG TPA: copper chaperone PCu(A)C [Caulobacteraceae bacterium]|nr:copper chaperone PCu(A)C [Caulobacteraceae bacterium]